MAFRAEGVDDTRTADPRAIPTMCVPVDAVRYSDLPYPISLLKIGGVHAASRPAAGGIFLYLKHPPRISTNNLPRLPRLLSPTDDVKVKAAHFVDTPCGPVRSLQHRSGGLAAQERTYAATPPLPGRARSPRVPGRLLPAFLFA